MDRRPKLTHLSSLTADQRAAMDDQVWAERRDAVAAVRTRVAMAVTIPVWLVGACAWVYAVLAAAENLGVTSDVLALVLFDALLCAIAIGIVTTGAAAIVGAFAKVVMGDD